VFQQQRCGSNQQKTAQIGSYHQNPESWVLSIKNLTMVNSWSQYGDFTQQSAGKSA